MRARVATSARTSSEQVHQDQEDSLLAAVMARPSGFMLPCGENGLSAVWMSTQHTKWCDPAAAHIPVNGCPCVDVLTVL